MTTQEILDMINKWRDLAEGSQVLYNQADHILAHEKPCLVCAEALNMLGSVNTIVGQVAVSFDAGMRSKDISMETIPELMVVSDKMEGMASWHAVATECVARMSNAAHKQLKALGIAPLDGCTVPHLITEDEKPGGSN